MIDFRNEAEFEITVPLPDKFNINKLFLFLYDSGFCYHIYNRIWIEDLTIDSNDLHKVMDEK